MINTVIIKFIAKYPTGPLLKAFSAQKDSYKLCANMMFRNLEKKMLSFGVLKHIKEIVKFIVFLITYHRLYNYLFVCLVF